MNPKKHLIVPKNGDNVSMWFSDSACFFLEMPILTRRATTYIIHMIHSSDIALCI